MNRRPLNRVTEEDVRRYEEDGVVCLRNMVDRDWVERMYDASMRWMDSDVGRVARNPDGTGRFKINTFMCRSDEDFRAFRDESPVAEIGAALMRVDEVRFWYDQLFVKAAKTSAITHWHHDLPYWPFRGSHLVSLWVAFTPVTRATSGVEYIAGSHKWNKFYRAVTPDEDPAFTDHTLEACPNFDDAAHRNDPKLRYLSWDLEPGDIVCHHPLTVHGAGGNESTTKPRVGLSIRFMGEDVTWAPRDNVIKLAVPPKVAAGDFPADDEVFPVTWRKDRVPATA
jgi:ectoine hydroxylase-related dioxygenase (phytanoyl-CoA dioxygenase family)